MKTLRLILGDQLNSRHSWFKIINSDIIYVMMEIRPETEYILHHGQKILAIFTTMRSFAKELKQSGHNVNYLHFEDNENAHSFEKNIKHLIKKYKIEHFEYQEPDEYRVDQKLSELTGQLNVSTKKHSTEHFFTQRKELKHFFEGKKACPFNSMFWSFVDKNREELKKNRRMGFLLSNWDKRTSESKTKVLEQATYYKKHVDSL